MRRGVFLAAQSGSTAAPTGDGQRPTCTLRDRIDAFLAYATDLSEVLDAYLVTGHEDVILDVAVTHTNALSSLASGAPLLLPRPRRSARSWPGFPAAVWFRSVMS